jgi:hypothetical protein
MCSKHENFPCFEQASKESLSCRDPWIVTRIEPAVPGHLISGLFHFAKYSVFCKVKQALVHATWYGNAIAVTIPGSSSRFFIKIVRLSRGAQMGFYVPVATVLCHTVRPPEPAMQKTKIIPHGRIGLLSFFASPSTRGAESFLYYPSMPWIDSTKRSGGNWPAEKVDLPFTACRSTSGVFSAIAKKTPDIF